MWSFQMAAQDGAQHGRGLEVAWGQLCPSDRMDRDGDTLGSGLAEGIFTVCLLWGGIWGCFLLWREPGEEEGLI